MPNVVTNTEMYSRAEVNINVTLSDLEQVVIETDKVVSYNWQTGIHTTEIRKFIVKGLIYEFDNFLKKGKGELRLIQLQGNFFLKGNKKIGGKEEIFYLSGMDKADRDKLIKQIPTNLHDHATKELTTKVKSNLDLMMSKGVVIDYA